MIYKKKHQNLLSLLNLISSRTKKSYWWYLS